MDAETRAVIERIIRSCVYGNLATISADGTRPCVRPVCAFLQDDLTLLVPTHSETRKVEEIRRRPEVEIVFVDQDHWQVRVQGRAEEVEDAALKRRLIETTLTPKLWRGFFPQGEHDPHFILYRIRPRAFEWMREWELRYRRIEVPSGVPGT